MLPSDPGPAEELIKAWRSTGDADAVVAGTPAPAVPASESRLRVMVMSPDVAENEASPGVNVETAGVEPDDGGALAVAQAARTRRLEVQVMLREFWYDSVDHSPTVAARINVAARLAHQAAEALSPETLL